MKLIAEAIENVEYICEENDGSKGEVERVGRCQASGIGGS